MRFVGAVLTGGASRRMGIDKATLLVDGIPMAVRVADALRAAGAIEVALIGSGVEGSDVAVVADEHPGEGPVGGLLTALAWAGDRRVVVAPCDLVAPSAEAFRRLVAIDGVAVVAGPDDPLPIALAPAGASVLAAAFAGGERALRRAVALLVPAVADLPEAAVADADTPSDLPPGAG